MTINQTIEKILVCTLFLLFTSCSGFLDPDPPTGVIVEDIAFENFEDLQSSLFGAYRFSTYNYFIAYLNSWASDDVQRSQDNGGIGTIYFNWTYNSSNSLEMEVIYLRCYRLILSVNKILENIDAVEGGTEAERNLIRAQCYALRAMAHFDLSRMFSPKISSSGDGSHLAIPYVKSSLDASALAAPNTLKEVYDNVLTDLNEAYDLFTTYNIASPTFMNKPAVEALQMRVALYQKDWASVIEKGESIIANSGLKLTSISDYPNMFSSLELDGEFIFKVGLAEGVNFSIAELPGTQNMGDAFLFGSTVNNYTPNKEFVSSFDRADVRPSVFFETITSSPSIDKVFIVKYAGTGYSGVADQPVLRLSEVYLSLAEAHYELGNSDMARMYLDDIRKVRILNYISIGETGTSLRDAIRLERRKELAYEGHRFFDLDRWNLGVDRGTSCTLIGTGNCNLDANDHKFVLPIPQHEINVNPNMAQNPGY